MSDESWHDAAPAAGAESVCYALRFDLSGKAHGKRARKDDARLARHIVAHLLIPIALATDSDVIPPVRRL